MPTRRRFLQGAIAFALFAGRGVEGRAASLPLPSPPRGAGGASTGAAGRPHCDQVDVFIGTGGHGHTYPGATRPFGMVQLSPDTRTVGWDACSGYHLDDASIMGFSHTHLSGTGASDMLDLLLMPATGEARIAPGPMDHPAQGYRSRYEHADEHAEPGYYTVLLKDYAVRAELSATERAGIHRYHFPAGRSGHLVLDWAHGIANGPDKPTRVSDADLRLVDDRTVLGGRRVHQWANGRHIYFALRLSRPFAGAQLYAEDRPLAASARHASGKRLKAILRYPDAHDGPLLVKVGLSGVSAANALRNLDAEIPALGFRPRARGRRRRLGARAGARGRADRLGRAPAHLLHRAVPQHAGADPVRRRRRALPRHGREGAPAAEGRAQLQHLLAVGHLPRAASAVHARPARTRAAPGQRPGAHGRGKPGRRAGVAAAGRGDRVHDRLAFGVGDRRGARQGLHRHRLRPRLEGIPPARLRRRLPRPASSTASTATCPATRTGSRPARRWSTPTATGPVRTWRARPATKPGTPRCGRARATTSTCSTPKASSCSRAWPTATGRRRSTRAAWATRDKYRDFTESNAWVATFLNQHDVHAYMRLFGGPEAFAAKLDGLFTASSKLPGNAPPDISGMIGQYAHGNEPSHHIAYLYAYAGQAHKTQARVRQILTTLYHDRPDGLAGNEDCGQMSAWYLLSAMGFYPVDPVSGNYVIGSPLFDRVTLDVGHGRRLVVEAKGNGPDRPYVQSATFNGQPHTRSWLRHADLAAGGRLVFEMGPKPNLAFGADPADRPPSFV